MFHFAHATKPLGHGFPRSVSGSCRVPQRSPWSALFPPPPPPRQPTPLCSAASSVLQRGPTPQRRSCPALRHIAFPDRSRLLREAAEVSRFSCMLFLMLFQNVLGSLTTPGPAFARDCRCRRCCLPTTAKGSAPECKVFEAQSPSPSMPLSTLRLPPHDVRRKTRGQDGIAFPFL